MLSNTNWDSSNRLKLFSFPGKQPMRKRVKGSAASPCSLAQEDLIFKSPAFPPPFPSARPFPSSPPPADQLHVCAFLLPISLRSEELCHQSPTETYFQRSALTQKSLGTAPSEQHVPALLRGESRRDRIQDVGPSAKHLSGSHISERSLYAADLVTGGCIYKKTHKGQGGWPCPNTLHCWAGGMGLIPSTRYSFPGAGVGQEMAAWSLEMWMGRQRQSVLGVCCGMKGC